VGCLDYFFIEPRFSLAVANGRDLVMLCTFLVSSVAVTGLARRFHGMRHVYREQAHLLDLTHDTIYLRDKHDVITYWNRGAEALYGWTSEEALGKTSFELLNPVLPIPYEDLTRMLQRDGRWEGVVVHTRRDGSKVSVSSRCILSRDDSGRTLGTFI